MTYSGKLIEYLDGGRFICAMVIENQSKRVHLINQNGRELNLPVSRIVHCSTRSYQTDLTHDTIARELREAHERRNSLMLGINLEELWELTAEEDIATFDPEFLAELSLGETASDDTVAAFLRCVFADRIFFKYREGKIKAHSPEQVQQIRLQLEKEKQEAELIVNGAKAISALMSQSAPGIQMEPWLENCFDIIRDYYLFGNEAKQAELARSILKEAQLTNPHDPFHILVKAGIWGKNENLPLLRNDIPVSFSLAARQQAESILQSSQQELFHDTGRSDLTHLHPLTIDGVTTLDFDDALTIEEQDGNFLVGIHISDVAHYVRPGDPLFQEAMRRGTSLYFPEGQIPMLPRHLSQGICSLIQNEIRATFSFMILLSAEAEVLRVRIMPSIIRVARRLSYEEADRIMASDPELRPLDMLRKKLRRRRLDNGALLLPFPDVNIFIDNNGRVHVSLARTDTPARTLISEFMILANSEAARYVADRMVPGLFRTQGPLKTRLVHGEDDDLFQNTRQRKQLPRGELLTTAGLHSGLGVAHYTTVTSPIRRLLDLVMQHQLNSIVRRREPCFSEEMCKDFTSVITRTVTTANNVRQQRHRYWLLKYLEDRKGQQLDALVIESGPRRVNLLLTDILMDADLPCPNGPRPVPGSTVKIRVAKVEALDNFVRFDW
jgi:exoribonuclease-2